MDVVRRLFAVALVAVLSFGTAACNAEGSIDDGGIQGEIEGEGEGGGEGGGD